MELSSDQIVFWRWGFAKLNATIVFTWGLMFFGALACWLVSRRLRADERLARGQNLLEVLVGGLRTQIAEVSQQDPTPFVPFVGTLFLFIAVSNLLGFVPGYTPPTGSLSTTAALAFCVFLAVPWFGIRRKGLRAYLRQYVQPTPIMLPFNIVGELSRTMALAVRLFGNVMSGGLVVALLVGLAPLFFPIVMQGLGLLTGLIQAYIFSVLAMVYIASATRAHEEAGAPPPPQKGQVDG